MWILMARLQISLTVKAEHFFFHRVLIQKIFLWFPDGLRPPPFLVGNRQIRGIAL